MGGSKVVVDSDSSKQKVAVDLDQIVREYQSTIYKKQKSERAVDFDDDDDDDDDLNVIDLDLFITRHMKDIANEKL